MKKIGLALLLACVVSQTAACGGSGSSDNTDDQDDVVDDTSDDISDGENAVIDVGWQWSTVAAPNSGSATCPPGTSITVHTQEVDANGDPVGQEILDIYDCETSNSVTPPLPPSTVSVFLSGSGGAGNFTSFTQFVDLTTENQVVDFDLIADGGFINFAWELVGDTSGDQLECSDVPDLNTPDSGVGAIVTVSGGTEAFDFKYDCEDHSGTTDPLLPGNYVVSVDAFTDAGSISPAPVNTNATVTAPNGIEELGLINIPIEGL